MDVMCLFNPVFLNQLCAVPFEQSCALISTHCLSLVEIVARVDLEELVYVRDV